MAVAHEASSAVRLEPAVSETAERLFQEHSGWIYGYCLRMLRSPEEAEDAVQATYLNACRSLSEGFQPRVDSAWLLRIAQNVCLTRIRSRGRRARLERVEDVTLLEETVAAPDRRSDELIGLTDALAGLSEHQRRAILLREWQGLSYAEVGARLGLTQSAVETLIFRARRSLAAALENPAKRRRLRLAHAFDVAGLLAVVKGWFAGNAAAQLTVAVAVAATAATVAADPVGVWRDRTPITPTPAAEQSSAAERTAGARVVPAAGDPAPGAASALTGPISSQAPFDAAERAFFAQAGGPAAGKGRDFGRQTAAEAKAGGKGKANGKATAPGQAKKDAGQATGPATGKAVGKGSTGGKPATVPAPAPQASQAGSGQETSPTGQAGGGMSQDGPGQGQGQAQDAQGRGGKSASAAS